MTVKLLTEQHLEFLSLKEGCPQASLALHMSKCNNVGNHVMAQFYQTLYSMIGYLTYFEIVFCFGFA